MSEVGESFLTQLPSLPSDMIGSPFRDTDPTKLPLKRISSNHGRSLEESMSSAHAIWADEFGNLFGSRSVKGLPPEYDLIKLRAKDDSPYGVDVFGLKDEVGLSRIQRASTFMRSHGLPTERITRADRVDALNEYGKRIPINEWKEKALKELSPELLRKTSRENVSRYFSENDFYVITREMQIGQRLFDVETWDTKDLLKKELGDIFTWLHTKDRIEAQKLANVGGQLVAPVRRFDENNPDDIKDYLEEYLPTTMGNYLARMHNLGLAHGFATGHNWALAGNLMDLDSVHGAPLGDNVITKKNKLHDIETTIIYGLNSLIPNSGYLFDILGGNRKDIAQRMFSTFLASYLSAGYDLSLEEIAEYKSLAEFVDSHVVNKVASRAKKIVLPPKVIDSHITILPSGEKRKVA